MLQMRMSKVVVWRKDHDCLRDELPRFQRSYRHERYEDGDIVRCSCGRHWLVLDGEFCNYREIRGRKLRKLQRTLGDNQ